MTGHRWISDSGRDLIRMLRYFAIFLSLLVVAVHGGVLDEMLQLTSVHGFDSWMRDTREHLHQIPELQFEEQETHAFIRAKLLEIGITNITTIAKTGIVAVIEPTSHATTVHGIALRSDMDALPIDEPERVGVKKSLKPGVSHACGHDAHMAMLLGAAWALKQVAEAGELKGKVVLIFQPAEEGIGGAKVMIEEGALEGVGAISGIHVWPAAQSGTLSTKPGPIMAASDRFSFVVVGLGGHAAIPHLAVDPVVAASAIVLALQSLVSRETSPTDSAVISVTRFNTGAGASNVIPSEVALKGTLRALTTETNERLHRRIEEVVVGTAKVHGCNISSFDWSPSPYPPTVNDATMVDLAADLLSGSELSTSFKILSEPSMAAEDFSYYGHHVPAIFAFLGIGDSTKGTDWGLHHPNFMMDDDALALGAAYHAAIALSWLDQAPLISSINRDEL